MDDESLEGDGPEAMDAPAPADELDPQAAADFSEAFPDLDDSQMLALQRGILGLMGR